ncbi:hypothetical protein [Paenibacillus turpanensis]|uniref:hypothetical protein n=1 Tax=Paenibacillus turpanensis TaxID=2689078 RepID=UPI001408E636|nr:hypothetical protein [Paenibacillus turpanensis]
MIYEMKTKELDEATQYPLEVLSGMTGLGMATIEDLARQGCFPIQNQQGERVVNGKAFLSWAHSVGSKVEVESSSYPTMEVPDK